MYRSWIAFAIFLFGGVAQSVLACSCMGSGPACTEALRPEVAALFRGSVLSIRPALRSLGRDVVVDLSVKETFKGLSGPIVQVITESSEAACGFSFKIGEEYLVYAYMHEGQLRVSLCSRTHLARHREEDLVYLRKMSRNEPSAEVYGEYKKYTFEPNFVPKFQPSLMDHYRPPEDHYRSMAPMTGETITLKSGKGQAFITKIDADGRFRFSGLPPGTYSIAASVPPKLAPPIGMPQGRIGSADSFQVQAGGCAQFVFRTQPDGRIGGIIVDAKGNPLSGGQVQLWKAGEQRERYGKVWIFAQEDGRFDLGPMPPGEYVVGAYLWKLPHGYPNEWRDQDRLREATLRYYDGTSDHAKAQTIVLAFGEHRRNLRIVIPFDPSLWKDVKVNPQ